MARKIVFNRRRRRIIGDKADSVEGESGRRVVVVVLFAIVREPKVQQVLLELPGNIIRRIYKRIIGLDRKVVEDLAGNTYRTWPVDLRQFEISIACVVIVLREIE